MVESPFGISKFVTALRTLAGEEMIRRRLVSVNLESVTAYRQIDEILKTTRVADSRLASPGVKDPAAPYLTEMDREERLEALERAMHEAAARLEFEKAAQYRDELERLRTEG